MGHRRRCVPRAGRLAGWHGGTRAFTVSATAAVGCPRLRLSLGSSGTFLPVKGRTFSMATVTYATSPSTTSSRSSSARSGAIFTKIGGAVPAVPSRTGRASVRRVVNSASSLSRCCHNRSPGVLGDETLTVPRYGGVLVGPDQLRQVFNDTDAEVLWLIVGGPEELEFLQGSKSKMDPSIRWIQNNYPKNSPGWNGHQTKVRSKG